METTTHNALAASFPVGSLVLNFGFRAEVRGYHDLHFAGDLAGLVLRDVTSHYSPRCHWLADPAKCTAVVSDSPVYPHPSALVVMA